MSPFFFAKTGQGFTRVVAHGYFDPEPTQWDCKNKLKKKELKIIKNKTEVLRLKPSPPTIVLFFFVYFPLGSLSHCSVLSIRMSLFVWLSNSLDKECSAFLNVSVSISRKFLFSHQQLLFHLYAKKNGYASQHGVFWSKNVGQRRYSAARVHPD